MVPRSEVLGGRPGAVGPQHAATHRDRDDQEAQEGPPVRAWPSEFIQLSTMVKLLETVLIVLREYPPFDALCRVPEEIDDDCDEPAQQSVKKRYEEIDALFNKYDAQVSAARLAKPRRACRCCRSRRLNGALRERSLGIVKKYRNNAYTSTCTPSSSRVTT